MQISLAFRSLTFGSLAFDGGGRAEDGGVDNRERWLCGRWLLGRWHLGGGGADACGVDNRERDREPIMTTRI